MKTTTSIILFCIFNFSWSQTLNLQSFGTGFTSPVEITHAGDARLFVVEQTGRIKILNTNGSVNATPFLNISTITFNKNIQFILCGSSARKLKRSGANLLGGRALRFELFSPCLSRNSRF